MEISFVNSYTVVNPIGCDIHDYESYAPFDVAGVLASQSHRGWA